MGRVKKESFFTRLSCYGDEEIRFAVSGNLYYNSHNYSEPCKGGFANGVLKSYSYAQLQL